MFFNASSAYKIQMIVELEFNMYAEENFNVEEFIVLMGALQETDVLEWPDLLHITKELYFDASKRFNAKNKFMCIMDSQQPDIALYIQLILHKLTRNWILEHDLTASTKKNELLEKLEKIKDIAALNADLLSAEIENISEKETHKNELSVRETKVHDISNKMLALLCIYFIFFGSYYPCAKTMMNIEDPSDIGNFLEAIGINIRNYTSNAVISALFFKSSTNTSFLNPSLNKGDMIFLSLTACNPYPDLDFIGFFFMCSPLILCLLIKNFIPGPLSVFKNDFDISLEEHRANKNPHPKHLCFSNYIRPETTLFASVSASLRNHQNIVADDVTTKEIQRRL